MKEQSVTKVDPAKLAKLDEIANNALASNLSAGQGFSAAVAMADAMRDLMDLLDDQIVDKFMLLQNTSLGFKTDRDPSRPRKGQQVEAYGRDVVKRCCAEAILKGVPVVKNCFNIIVSNAYVTREGFHYLLSKLPGFTDFEKVIGVPKALPDEKGMMFVSCKARWLFKGKPGSLSWEKDDPPTNIVIPLDEWTKPDAVTGKAERKFLRRVYEQVTGCQVTDGDVDEPGMLREPKVAQLPEGPKPTAPVEVLVDKPEDEIKKRLKLDGVSEDELLAALKDMGFADDKIVDLYQLSSDKLQKVLKAWPGIIQNLRLTNGGK
jgi:hypothetical protein